jgi:hypothetical protein
MQPTDWQPLTESMTGELRIGMAAVWVLAVGILATSWGWKKFKQFMWCRECDRYEKTGVRDPSQSHWSGYRD